LVGGEAAMVIVEKLHGEMAEVHEDMIGLHRALETQLTRIAQIQYQLDELRSRFNSVTKPPERT
jgi:hypothetical protein